MQEESKRFSSIFLDLFLASLGRGTLNDEDTSRAGYYGQHSSPSGGVNSLSMTLGKAVLRMSCKEFSLLFQRDERNL
ncbi:hypothetical protein BTVI_05998 [Pitangus sulphuratus]|nr:hypothetical protein BTVI_05998 [Pitangus sulphuratus]